MISKMVQAYKSNPDHFNERKAGGTLKDQEEAKKRMREIDIKRGQKDTD